jgi:hypothetical protein
VRGTDLAARRQSNTMTIVGVGSVIALALVVTLLVSRDENEAEAACEFSS